MNETLNIWFSGIVRPVVHVTSVGRCSWPWCWECYGGRCVRVLQQQQTTRSPGPLNIALSPPPNPAEEHAERTPFLGAPRARRTSSPVPAFSCAGLSSWATSCNTCCLSMQPCVPPPRALPCAPLVSCLQSPRDASSSRFPRTSSPERVSSSRGEP